MLRADAAYVPCTIHLQGRTFHMQQKLGDQKRSSCVLEESAVAAHEKHTQDFVLVLKGVAPVRFTLETPELVRTIREFCLALLVVSGPPMGECNQPQIRYMV